MLRAGVEPAQAGHRLPVASIDRSVRLADAEVWLIPFPCHWPQTNSLGHESNVTARPIGSATAYPSKQKRLAPSREVEQAGQ